MTEKVFYVYVYIDPRNHEEFYYGKGKGSRRLAHLSDESDSEKVARIRAIQAEGLEPIIRTVAAGLSENEAHLVETTLIWKLGKGLTNRASGRFASQFRPQNTLHRELAAFDFQNGIYYVNVGQGDHRHWEDCRRLGFLSAGQGAQWRDQILDLVEGDIVVPYLKGYGYVGVGKVGARAVPFLEFRHEGRPLSDCNLQAPHMSAHCEDHDNCEYVLRVQWIAAVPQAEARWKPGAGLYTTPLIRASLERQAATMDFIEQSFGLNLKQLAT